MADLLTVLIGTWKLLSYDMFTISDSKVSVVQLAGSSPLGRITFTSDQYMSVLVTAPSVIAPTASSAWHVATDEEVLRVARPMTTYCGRFQLLQEGEDHVLSTSVSIALDPNWVGTEQRRKVELKEDGERTVLTLRPTQYFLLPNGAKATAALVWEKLPDDEV